VVLSRIVPGLEPGAIVLLHDAAERTDARPTSLDALPGLLEEMKARDLRSVTISELVGSARVQASAVPEGAAP
jgi:peptidoglycan/xylan/chitin deacetylase (PgdA/CDA1 family)